MCAGHSTPSSKASVLVPCLTFDGLPRIAVSMYWICWALAFSSAGGRDNWCEYPRTPDMHHFIGPA
jgi:hypothetical protein